MAGNGAISRVGRGVRGTEDSGVSGVAAKVAGMTGNNWRPTDRRMGGRGNTRSNTRNSKRA